MLQLRKTNGQRSVESGPAANARFLVICAQGFGDALEATPMLHELRALRPKATIDVVVTLKPVLELFEELPQLVNAVIYLPLWESGRRQFVRHLIAKRWRRRYDAVICCYPAVRPEYHILSFSFPSRKRVAHKYGDVTIGSLLWLNTDLAPLRKIHNVLRNLDLLRALGLKPSMPTGYVVPSTWITPASERNPRGVAFHVGTVVHHGRESRRWPLEYFAELARRLLASGYSVDIVAGPHEVRESELVRSLAPGANIFQGTLPEVGRFLSSRALVVTNDNGIGHLAAGVGATVVSLFGPTPLEHAPFGPSSCPIRLSSCAPCFDVRKLHSKCERNVDFECLKADMPPDLVFRNIQELLAVDEADAELNILGAKH
jgi:heptosyltransferase II